MAFSTVLSPTVLSNSGFVFDWPNITTLSDGSFALTFLDQATTNSVISYVYSAQGTFLGGGPAMPLASLQAEYSPDLAALAGSGGYALAWTEFVMVGNFFEPVIYSAVYDARGNQLTTPAEASGGTIGDDIPEVTALPNGGYVLTWASSASADGSGDIWTRIFDSAGQPVTAAIDLTGSLGQSDQMTIRATPIVVLPNGNLLYSWSSSTDTQNGEIYTAVYAPDGQQIAGPANLSNSADVIDGDPQVAVLTGGHYAMAWFGEATQGGFVYTAVFDVNGDQITAPFVVAPGQVPDIVALSNGDYALAWASGDIFTAVFDAQGALVSPIVNVTNTVGLDEGDVKIAALENGTYALTWSGQAGGTWDLFTAVYDAQGNARVAAQNITNTPADEDVLPAIASEGNGTYAITWMNTIDPFWGEKVAIFRYDDDTPPGNHAPEPIADTFYLTEDGVGTHLLPQVLQALPLRAVDGTPEILVGRTGLTLLSVCPAWCAPCRAFSQDSAQLQAQLAALGVSVAEIIVDDDHPGDSTVATAADAAAWIADTGSVFETWHVDGSVAVATTLADALGITAFPHYVLYDPLTLRIVADFEGYGGVQSFVDGIADVLAHGGDSGPPFVDNVIYGASHIDADSDGDLLHVSAVNGDAALVGTSVTLASGAKLTVQANGAFKFDPHGAYDYLNASESTTETFTYTVSDGHGGSASTTVTLNIDGADDPATFSGSATGGVMEDAVFTAIGALVAHDPDDGESGGFAAETVTGSYGTLQIDAGGSWTYTLTQNAAAAIQSLAASSAPLQDTLTVHATDGTAATITIDIFGTNDPAVIGGTITGAVTKGGNQVANGLLTISDPDANENHFSAGTYSNPGIKSGVGFGRLDLTADGHWTYTLDPTLPQTQALLPGQHATDTVTVASADGTTQTITIDVAASAVASPPPVITGFTPDTGVQGDHVTEAQFLVISGTAAPGTFRVTVSDGTFTVVVTPDAGGNWSTPAHVFPLGSHGLTATATDTSGNVSAPSGPFAIDVALPPPPVITGFTPDTGVQGDHVTEAQFLVVSGTSEPGTVRVVVSDGTFTVAVTPDADGNWSTPAHVFPFGAHSFTATATNAFGNESVASKTFAIDVVLPPPPVITGFTPDTGAQGDHITEAQTLVVSGSSEPGTKEVQVSDNHGHVVAVSPQANGNWSATLSNLPLGIYDFTAVAVNDQGNQSAASKVFEVAVLDLTPPAAPIITGFTPDTGVKGDHITEAHTLTVSGTSEPDVREVRVSDGAGHIIAVQAAPNGDWSATFNTLPFGSYSFTATAEDSSGNISTASAVFAIDVVPVPPPVITGFAPDTGVVGDHITQSQKLVVSGTSEPGTAQVRVSDDHGRTVIATPAADGAWSAEFANLAAGTYDFTAVAINELGTTSNLSKGLEIIVDPAAPVITSNGGGDSATVSIAENTTAVTTVHATDADNQTIHYAIAGGADQARFQIDPLTGALAFVTPPDFEAPADADGNNSYVVQVRATDGVLSDLQTITVNVTNQNGIVRSGTALPDVLIGTPEADTLSGLGGNDQIFGLAGDDTLNGGVGNDLIDGGAGNDMLDGGTGADNMTGGAGDDIYIVDNAGDVVTEGANQGTDEVHSSVSYTLGADVENLTLTTSLLGSANINGIGNALDNIITGNNGNNSLAGGGGDDALNGGGGADLLDGGAGNDRLDGGNGADTMTGGQGNDVYVVDNARDVVNENPNQGIDEVIASVDTTLGANLENLTLTGRGNIDGTGNALDNVISGNGGNNTLAGGAGHDTLDGGGGDDTLDGGSGADAMAGGTGDDTYVVDNAADTVTERLNQGIDAVLASVTFALGANIENLTLTGSANINGSGNALDNTLTGNIGDNVLDGGAGADRMEGGAGDDLYLVDNAGDRVMEGAHHGLDQVIASVTFTLGGNVENLTLVGNANIDGIGNGLDNVIIGNSGSNTLLGGGGDDRLDGGAGADTLVGATGDDTYIVDNPADVVIENARQGTDQVLASASYALGANIEMLTLTGSLDINGTGNALDNTLTGNSGDNRLDGGAGADAMAGGVGADTYIVDNIRDSIVEGADKATDQVFASVSFVLPVNVENLTLTGSANIAATGNAVDNVLTGNAGNNILTGLGGNDTLDGGAGADTMAGGIGDDLYFVDNAGDTVNEGLDQGTDEVRSSVSFTLGANVEKLTLTGTADISGTGNGLDNVITGNAGKNVLSGGDGNDRLNGGSGADVMVGGQGRDIYFVDDPGDVIIETFSAVDVALGNSDSVFASVSYALSDEIEDLILTGTGNINGTGNALSNRITGTAGDNVIAGGGGNDTLRGGEGSDTYLFGNSGFDIIDDTGTTGTDVMLATADDITIGIFTSNFASTGIERVDANGHSGVTLELVSSSGFGWDFSAIEVIGIARIVASGFGHGQIKGSAGDDIIDATRTDFVDLRGGAGDDTLISGPNSDTLDGEEGSDTYLIGPQSRFTFGADNISDSGTIGTDVILATADDISISILGGNFFGIERIDANGHTGVTIEGAGGSPFGWNFSQTELIGIARIVAGAATHGSIVGSAGDDVLDGSHADFITLRGGAGDDTLIGSVGSDTLDGGEGSDTYLIGPQSRFTFGADNISDSGTIGTDVILATADDISISIVGGNFVGIERIDANGHTGVTIEGASGIPFAWDFSQTELIDITRIVVGNSADGGIVGSAGDDVLDGRRSEFFVELHGGAGNDTLIGGGGNDTLSGDLGADTFVFNFGADIVTDYEAGIDLFDFTAITGLEAYSDLQPFMSEVGADVLIDFGTDGRHGTGHSITIQNTTIATLNAHQGDFLV
jgi:VCBS repeat-containing protein